MGGEMGMELELVADELRPPRAALVLVLPLEPEPPAALGFWRLTTEARVVEERKAARKKGAKQCIKEW